MPCPEQLKEAKKHAQDALSSGQSHQQLPGVWYSGRENFRRRLPREHGRSQGGGARQIAAASEAALVAMKPGQVSDLIQIEQAYTIIRLNAHSPAHKLGYEEVKTQLRTDLQKSKYEKLRANLDKQLRAKSKVEILSMPGASTHVRDDQPKNWPARNPGISLLSPPASGGELCG